MVGVEEGMRGMMEEWQRKLERGILPPDPARVIKEILDGPVEIEHVVPVPPLIERIHSEFTVPFIEKLPRLPMTAEFPFKRWLVYKEERW